MGIQFSYVGEFSCVLATFFTLHFTVMISGDTEPVACFVLGQPFTTTPDKQMFADAQVCCLDFRKAISFGPSSFPSKTISAC